MHDLQSPSPRVKLFTVSSKGQASLRKVIFASHLTKLHMQTAEPVSTSMIARKVSLHFHVTTLIVMASRSNQTRSTSVS